MKNGRKYSPLAWGLRLLHERTVTVPLRPMSDYFRLPSKRIFLAITIWAIVVGVGFFLLLDFQTTPGNAGAPRDDWPANSRIQPDPERANLVMLVHPRCPCTRASLGELAQLMTRCRNLVTAHVLCFKPREFEQHWEKTDLWESADAIPGVNVISDEGGQEIELFGAYTSGHVLLYDSTGKLLFSGGITASRGHSGDNSGRSAIVSLLTQGMAEQTETFVFGCPLRD
jgi:hypothetical protein